MQPYKLECLQHFIGSCCMQAIRAGDKKRVCPVCEEAISGEFEWRIDQAALDNR